MASMGSEMARSPKVIANLSSSFSLSLASSWIGSGILTILGGGKVLVLFLSLVEGGVLAGGFLLVSADFLFGVDVMLLIFRFFSGDGG